MKKKLILLFSFVSIVCFGQKINLQDIIKNSYSANRDINIVKGYKINYILPYEIDFINKKYDSKSNVNLYSNKNEFLNYLKTQDGDVLILTIIYENLRNNYIDLVLEIDKTDYQKYNNERPFLVFEDKRSVRLKYDVNKGWVFDKIIKIYDEPSVDITN